jgi:hypothetical protein
LKAKWIKHLCALQLFGLYPTLRANREELQTNCYGETTESVPCS